MLRPSLLPGLLQNAALNLNKGAASVRLFEVGTAFTLFGKSVGERRQVAGLILGPVTDRYWRPARVPDADFYDAKGIVLDLLSSLLPALKAPVPLNGAQTKSAGDPVFHPSASLHFETAAGPVATVGLLHPTAARAFELERQTVALFEIDLDALLLLEPAKIKFTPYSQFQVSRRDLSLLAPLALPFSDVRAAVRPAMGESFQSLGHRRLRG